ncbi:ATP-binding protein [Actinomycetospora endophytica]|uniref:ATP-binding protein n=1 Tax=Actinomycetospora endophytica TaxID=2291215 RepID=A0ABS8PHU3_9PSEU|nr:ATP-binding protein [Actinomycetospora endophytica]MCD2197075.1 ATP-binding protein [Actinomycetospora endophytica]
MSGTGPVGSGITLARTATATRADASALRRSFRTWLAELADEDTVDDLTLAVYEALANVVDHAYAATGTPGEMRLWAAASPPLDGGRDLVVTISDDGAWRRSGEPGWRGRGIPLMHTLSCASVLSGTTGTTIRLRRWIEP